MNGELVTTKSPAAPAGDYLHACLDLHPRLTRIRYGREQNLDRIRVESNHVRSSRRLTYEDVERIRNAEIWNADQFGYWPSRTDVESRLTSTEWDLWNLPRKEDEAIANLLSVFRQIELVSVILNFVVPKHYGIMSPPVEKVLAIGPFRRHTERYRAYSEILRELRDDRGFATAADVNMALWVLQVGVLDGLLKGTLSDDEYEGLREEHKQDSRLREIRVGNLTRQLFEDMDRLDLADALLATNVELAGQIAAIEFERSIKRHTQSESTDRSSLRQLVEELCRTDRLASTLKVRALEAIGTRNDAVHGSAALKHGEVRRLIETTKTMRRIAET